MTKEQRIAGEVMLRERNWAVCTSATPVATRSESERGNELDQAPKDNPKSNRMREYWARMTPEQRKAEMVRRRQKGEQQ